MFDYVIATCPSCDAELEEQTKDGPCDLNTYEVGKYVYPEVAALLSGMRFYCNDCEEGFEVKTDLPTQVRTWLG